VGGFQLLVDATNAAAVARLRQRKRRPHKPLALLVADADGLAGEVRIPPAARRALQTAAAPIVLLRRLGASSAGIAAGVAPGSAWLGVMLPASPLHLLLAQAVGRPLVASSGNPSGEPLCTAPAEAVERLAGIADAFLVHNRPIARPLDDSLLQLIEGRPVLLRRARGYAPAALALPRPPPADRAALALGGDLKAAPALAIGGRVWLAPHQGDLAAPLVQQRLEAGLEALLQRHGAELEVLVADSHPGYGSSRLARQVAHRQRLPLRAVQHHQAHGLAVAAEHGLAGPLLVWAADGLGYGPGPGHQLWGGELLWLAPAAGGGGWRMERLACLRPWPLPGGERAMAEPRRAALGLLTAAGCWGHAAAAAPRRAFPDPDRELLEQALRAGVNAPLTSSLGRLFDAVASLLDLVQVLSFEGQAGLLLEGLARSGGARAWDAAPVPLCPCVQWLPVHRRFPSAGSTGGRCWRTCWRGWRRACRRRIWRPAGTGAWPRVWRRRPQRRPGSAAAARWLWRAAVSRTPCCWKARRRRCGGGGCSRSGLSNCRVTTAAWPWANFGQCWQRPL
jgi:hydrogenase maturation protein HypF